MRAACGRQRIALLLSMGGHMLPVSKKFTQSDEAPSLFAKVCALGLCSYLDTPGRRPGECQLATLSGPHLCVRSTTSLDVVLWIPK